MQNQLHAELAANEDGITQETLAPWASRPAAAHSSAPGSPCTATATDTQSATGGDQQGGAAPMESSSEVRIARAEPTGDGKGNTARAKSRKLVTHTIHIAGGQDYVPADPFAGERGFNPEAMLGYDDESELL